MADFSTLIATLQATIRTNYNQEITGQILQDDLLAMVNTINQLKQDTLEGYGFYGAPLADGASVNVTQNTFFLVGPGTYTINGEANTIAGAGISVLVYDSVNDEVRVDTLISYDTTPTAASKNAITSGAVHTALADKQDKDADAVAGNVAVMNASGDSEDGGVPLADLATKAEVAVLAGEAGLAEAMIDTDGAGTEQQFTFRKSGGDGGAYYRKIKGKTIVVDDQLASNDAEAVETTGANQWDEEWEEGGIDGNGDKTAQPDNIRTKNYNPCAAGTTYYVKATELVIYFYDSNKTMLPFTGPGAYINGLDITDGNTFVAPNGACYFLFRAPSYGSTYNHDICINLSNPAINGQYFPYWKRTLQLGITTRKDTDGNVPFADGMKGAGTAADWADKVGGEKRMGRVDLGSLEWSYAEDRGLHFFFASWANAPSGIAIQAAAVCSKYPCNTDDGNTQGDNTLSTNWINWHGQAIPTVRICDSSHTAADLVDGHAAWLEGVMLDYELATPVPFTWAEPLNLGVKVDENGTERAVAPEGATAPSAPFVADTTYTMSVARMVEKLQNL